MRVSLLGNLLSLVLSLDIGYVQQFDGLFNTVCAVDVNVTVVFHIDLLSFIRPSDAKNLRVGIILPIFHQNLSRKGKG